MSFIADLHIHSHYSRATARNLDLENLHYWAQLKGLTVVGTGDFTHPSWVEEIEEKLIPAEEGLFRLKPELASPIDASVPEKCRRDVRFILSSEISNIYKKGDKTRKNHNVILMPGLDQVKEINQRLDAIGNITSDGRPILGLDAKNLLEIMLEVDGQGIFIPAHIWTPWFSLLGSKSGFDSIEECFEDLSGHIFALETGLSSDPPMNWRVSNLDGRTLVSNSDAHSPAKLAREANIFESEMSFPAMREALRSGEKFWGTIEFFPEEGKYHLDGHRKCGVRMAPGQSIEKNCLCPECGKPMTLGVLHRVEALADRGDEDKPAKTHPFVSLVPLKDILSNILGVGPASKKVDSAYMECLKTMGSELEILKDLHESDLKSAPVPLLDEAILRMRSGNIVLKGGFDGEFGTVAVFEPEELDRLMGQRTLFNIPKPPKTRIKKKKPEPGLSEKKTKIEPKTKNRDDDRPDQLNPQQQNAVCHNGGPLLIKAGPGTGKTRTLTQRIAHLVESGVDPSSILAITFTNQASGEMRSRLEKLLGDQKTTVGVSTETFHSLCLRLLKEQAKKDDWTVRVLGEKDRGDLIRAAIQESGKRSIDLKLADSQISLAKQKLASPPMADFSALDGKAQAMADIYQAYQDLLAQHGFVDFDDLLFKVVRLAEADFVFRDVLEKRFSHVCVDEYQDVNQAQYRLLKFLSPNGEGLMAIGDPDQAIYGFRGADVGFFNRFTDDFPGAVEIELCTNYRSTETVLAAAGQILQRPESDCLHSGLLGRTVVDVLETPTSRAEAEAIVHAIEKSVGGVSHFSIDSQRVDQSDAEDDWAFSDFAVLYRSRLQLPPLLEAFDRSGIPYQTADKKKLADHPGVDELLSYLRLVHGQGSDLDLLRIMNFPKRGIGDKTIAALRQYAEKRNKHLVEALDDARRLPLPGMTNNMQLRLHMVWKTIKDQSKTAINMPLGQALERMIRDVPIDPLLTSGGAARTVSSVLLDLAAEFPRDPAGFCDHVAMAGDIDTRDPAADRVTLMTMHAAKGLEFNGVFVAGCEDGLIPFRSDDISDPDEELRLFYVAVTRAKKRLWLTYARRRRIYGKVSPHDPSPFLERIHDEIKDLQKPFKKKKKPAPVQASLFD